MNENYDSYIKSILFNIGFLSVPYEDRVVILIDGSNLVHPMSTQIEKGIYKRNINNVVRAIKSYFTDLAPTCNLVIDIVMKHLYSFLPETIDFGPDYNDVIMSYTRRPQPNNPNEGNLTEAQINLQKTNPSYDDAIILRKLYVYSAYAPIQNIFLVSCDGYKDYRTVFRLSNNGLDFQAVETTYYIVNNKSVVEKFLHNITYQQNKLLEQDIDTILQNVNRVSNVPLREYIYTYLNISRYYRNMECSRITIQNPRRIAQLINNNCNLHISG